MGRAYKPNCSWCGAAREKGKVCPCRQRASYEKHRERYLQEAKEKYESDPEYFRRKALQWQAEHRDRAVAAHLAWREKNRDYYNEWMRAYNERNKERRNATRKKWKLANPEAVRVYVHRRRKNLLAAGPQLTAAQWIAICEGQEHKCFDCERGDVSLTIGHIIPLCRGGGNHPDNIIAQCGPCNSKQGRHVHPKFAAAFAEETK